jgi:hypothetical protein
MLRQVLRRLSRIAGTAVRAVRRRLASALRPAATGSLVLGAASDLVRSKPEPVAENAFLRQQLIVLARSMKGRASADPIGRSWLFSRAASASGARRC